LVKGTVNTFDRLAMPGIERAVTVEQCDCPDPINASGVHLQAAHSYDDLLSAVKREQSRATSGDTNVKGSKLRSWFSKSELTERNSYTSQPGWVKRASGWVLQKFRIKHNIGKPNNLKHEIHVTRNDATQELTVLAFC
jgi:hypothetical protein